MEQTLPTPYDIVGLPLFAWQPGMLSWIIFSALAVFAIGLPFILKRRRFLINAWRLGLNELNSLPASGQVEIVKLALASSIAKRLCGLLEKRDFSGLSPKELEIAASGCQASLAHLLNRLAAIDRLRYGAAPQTEQQTSALIAELTDLLQLHWQTKQEEVKK